MNLIILQSQFWNRQWLFLPCLRGRAEYLTSPDLCFEHTECSLLPREDEFFLCVFVWVVFCSWRVHSHQELPPSLQGAISVTLWGFGFLSVSLIPGYRCLLWCLSYGFRLFVLWVFIMDGFYICQMLFVTLMKDSIMVFSLCSIGELHWFWSAEPVLHPGIYPTWSRNNIYY